LFEFLVFVEGVFLDQCQLQNRFDEEYRVHISIVGHEGRLNFERAAEFAHGGELVEDLVVDFVDAHDIQVLLVKQFGHFLALSLLRVQQVVLLLDAT